MSNKQAIRTIGNQKTTTQPSNLSFGILIPSALVDDYLNFLTLLKHPTKETQYIDEGQFEKIRKLLIDKYLDSSTRSKAEKLAAKKNYDAVKASQKLVNKFALSQILFLLPFVRKNGEPYMSEEEIAELRDKILRDKILKNPEIIQTLLEMQESVANYDLEDSVMDAFIEDRAEELGKENDRLRDENSRLRSENDQLRAKKSKKADSKFEKAFNQEVEAHRATKSRHDEELSEIQSNFEAERTELMDQIEELRDNLEKSQSDLTTKKNDYIKLNRSYTSQTKRIEKLEAQLKELEKPEGNSEKIRLTAENIQLKAQFEEAKVEISKLRSQIESLKSAAPIAELIHQIMGRQTESILNQNLQQFSTRLSNLEQMVKGQQARISQETAPQIDKKEKPVETRPAKQIEREKRINQLLAQGFSVQEIETLAKLRILVIDRQNHKKEFERRWSSILGENATFQDLEKYSGDKVDSACRSHKFDFVILTRHRNHGSYDYQMKTARNSKKFLDECYFGTVNVGEKSQIAEQKMIQEMLRRHATKKKKGAKSKN